MDQHQLAELAESAAGPSRLPPGQAFCPSLAGWAGAPGKEGSVSGGVWKGEELG